MQGNHAIVALDRLVTNKMQKLQTFTETCPSVHKILSKKCYFSLKKF